MQLDLQKGNFMWLESNMNVYIVVVMINHMSGIICLESDLFSIPITIKGIFPSRKAFC